MQNITETKGLELSNFINNYAKKRTVKNITLAELVYKLSEISEGNYTKGYMVSVTEPKMNKRGNDLFGRVKKVCGWGFDTNADYSRKVNLQLEREGKEANFEALPTWAEPVNKVVYRHKEKTEQLYASVYPTTNFGYFSKYFVDGRPATESELATIEIFTPEKSESSRQGTEKTIQIRRVKMENIHIITLKGQRYAIKDNNVTL